MIRALGLLFAVVVASAGCGDDEPPPPLTHGELRDRLYALPGVTVKEESTEHADLRFYVLQFTQLVDHDDPSQGTFQQRVSLLHRSERAPMIVHTSGYSDYTKDNLTELTKLLVANQVSIEHRFFGGSRPVPADWSKLTIKQAAEDEHEIIAALRTIYEGAFLSTGGSKGGMTAVFHRRFHPDDVDGTVAYVAPISFGAPDKRYPGHLESIGSVYCRTRVQDLAVEMLANRREAIRRLAEAQARDPANKHSYNRIKIGAAVEAAIAAFEWAFWQYAGEEECGRVPAVDASDEAIFAFLDEISPVSDNDDDRIARFEAYYYQARSQLGFPDCGTSYLAPYLRYSAEDYVNELPGPPPDYDIEAMLDIGDFVEHRGDRLLFVYGEWDPWTGGQFALGDAQNSEVFLDEKGTHNAKIMDLTPSLREEAFAMLREWTGVSPVIPRQRATGAKVSALAVEPPRERTPRVPPALLRALAARK